MTCAADHGHGVSQTCYTNHGCRCDDCREFARLYKFWLRHHRAADRVPPHVVVDGRGVRRRLQALYCLGYAAPALAARMGVDRQLILQWLERDQVAQSTHDRVEALYAELSMQPAPEVTGTQRYTAARSRKLAAEKGWVPPLAWDDIDADDAPIEVEESDDIDVVAVDLVTSGVALELTIAERHRVVADLNRRGYYDTEIATFVKVDERTIARDRKALGIPAVDPAVRDELLNPMALAA